MELYTSHEGTATWRGQYGEMAFGAGASRMISDRIQRRHRHES